MKIKNHEILAEISRGALTTVYKARHLNLDRSVLLKVLNQQWLGEKDLLDRFRREAKISARLQHKNIVNVYDFEVSDKLVYISLEYVEGQTLQRYISENNPVPFPTVISIFRDILNALVYAHENGVIHRDIKSANIMLDDGLRARLTDFGLASFGDIHMVTEQGQSMGTPAYMAPEQIQGKSGTVQSDLYSLGVTVFELLSGSNPFQKENIAATLQNVLNAETPDIRKFRDDVPDWFVEILNALLAPLPENRPDARQVLLELPGDKPAEQTPGQVIGGTPKKNRIIRTGIFLAVIVLLFFIFWPDEDMPRQVQGALPDTSDVIPFLPKAKDGLKDKLGVVQPNAKKQPTVVTTVPTVLGGQKDNPDTGKNTTLENVQGYIFITCTPWAKVIIDGDSVDVTPMQGRIGLFPGPHDLRLENPNYKTYHKKINVMALLSDTINVNLKPAFGYVMIKVSPWARLYINDHYKEDTPLSAPLIVASGRNILKLINPALGAIIDTIYVKPGETVEKQFTFSK